MALNVGGVVVEMKYKVDIGNTISGFTVEIEARTALSAYEQSKVHLDEDKCHRVIQIRNDQDFVVYSWQDQNGLFPKMRE